MLHSMTSILHKYLEKAVQQVCDTQIVLYLMIDCITKITDALQELQCVPKVMNSCDFELAMMQTISNNIQCQVELIASVKSTLLSLVCLCNIENAIVYGENVSGLQWSVNKQLGKFELMFGDMPLKKKQLVKLLEKQ
ncbi:hypothetical protein T4C_6054 [Trichinella pseudospiralis]|uniref:Uncharacterized protein n=1 Tax=Trichinella pseudospiralis TaxID=6337 RepID=A0A0V1K6E1_TRIPS|nr:hypothetical protein T4C_6054 [Trichinella pseudospiralis]